MNKLEKPIVTVIVPAYNHQEWVKESILSVINQTYGYENIQLIVTDDCSTDNTPKILKDLAEIYDFDLILHQRNNGICSTLNEMISLSKGKYITSIASDDIMFVDKIEKQINILNEHPDIDILAGSCFIIDKDGNNIYSFPIPNEQTLITYSFEDLFLMLKPGFPAGSIIIKRDLFQKIGAYDSNYKVEDYYFLLKAAANKAKIVRSNLPFNYYRLHRSSFSCNFEVMELEVDKILEIYKDHPKYSKALQNRKLFNLSKGVFNSKLNVISSLIGNPTLFLNKNVIKLLVMLVLPNIFIQGKFLEDSFRNARS